MSVTVPYKDVKKGTPTDNVKEKGEKKGMMWFFIEVQGKTKESYKNF